MEQYKLISITHHTAPLEVVGEFIIPTELRQEKLEQLKEEMNIEELLYTGTCNRAEFLIITDQTVDTSFLRSFIHHLFPDWSHDTVDSYLSYFKIHKARSAIQHLFEVAASLDSMVVGEREILHQLRTTYNWSRKTKLAGDYIRIAMEEAVRTAKHIFTATRIGEKPVSVVSLAYRKLEKCGYPNHINISLIGTGKTNQLMGKFLIKGGYKNFTLYNRTPSHGEELANRLQTEVYPLEQLTEPTHPPSQVLITCTGATQPIIDTSLWKQWEADNITPDTVVDLGLPSDLSSPLQSDNSLNYIGLSELQEEAEENLAFRKEELQKAHKLIDKHLSTFDELYEEREVEKAIKTIPRHSKHARQ